MGEDLIIPDKYSIRIRGFGGNNYRVDSTNNLYVEVLESLDRHHGDPPIQHVRRVGSFRLDQIGGKSTNELLRQVREGIGKLLNNPSS